MLRVASISRDDRGAAQSFCDSRNAATSGSSGMELWRQAGKDLAIELGMRLPGLAGDDAAIANGVRRDARAAGLLRFEADVFIASNTLASSGARGGKHLDTMADGENPLLVCVEFTDKIE